MPYVHVIVEDGDSMYEVRREVYIGKSAFQALLSVVEDIRLAMRVPDTEGDRR